MGAPAAARSAWTFHVLVLAVAVRLPRRPVGVICVGTGFVDVVAVTPRATPLVTRGLPCVGVRGKRERLSGRCTPVPSRDKSILLLVTTGRKPPGPNAGGAPRGRGATRTFRRTPGGRTDG
jgi:hypothetical protein